MKRITTFLLLLPLLMGGCNKNEEPLNTPSITWKTGWLNNQITSEQRLLLKVESSYGTVQEARLSLRISEASGSWKLTTNDFKWTHHGSTLEGQSKVTFYNHQHWRFSFHLMGGEAKINGRCYPIR